MFRQEGSLGDVESWEREILRGRQQMLLDVGYRGG
jgi:hypothetical protein